MFVHSRWLWPNPEICSVHRASRRGWFWLDMKRGRSCRILTGTRNTQVFCRRNAPSRYLSLTAGKAILFDFTGCLHSGEGCETIDQVRPSKTASLVAAGPEIQARKKAWATEMADLITELVGWGATVGLERLNAGTANALQAGGLRIVDAQQPVEMARSVKSTEEMKCINASLRATENGVAKLRAAIRPGMAENELWSVLHQSVIAENGDYCQTRLLNAGARSNPWFQETAGNAIGENALIARDTDVVGCHGYYSDFSGIFHAGPDKQTEAQRALYKVAYEQVQSNMGILHAGMRFRDYADPAWVIPAKCHENRDCLSCHGCGMTGEYPYLYHKGDFPDAGYVGEIFAGMTFCVQSDIGEAGGAEDVKLEQQVLVTETGIELLSRFPFEDELLRPPASGDFFLGRGRGRRSSGPCGPQHCPAHGPRPYVQAVVSRASLPCGAGAKTPKPVIC